MDENIKNRLNIEIDKAYYISLRYKSISTFAILYFEGELLVEDLGGFVRLSDHLLKIDENHYFINYTFTDNNAAFKASQNLLLYLDEYFGHQKSCIALDVFDSAKPSGSVLDRLLQTLSSIQKQSKSRIADESILKTQI